MATALDDYVILGIKTTIDLLKDVITSESPLIGIEPSAILSFRDEYPDLVGNGACVYGQVA